MARQLSKDEEAAMRRRLARLGIDAGPGPLFDTSEEANEATRRLMGDIERQGGRTRPVGVTTDDDSKTDK